MENRTPMEDVTLSTDPTRDPAAPRKRERRAWVFEPGQVVGERYRIVRFIAAGGIGEVYEAEDQELGGRVALKTLRGGLEASEATVARFRREVQLARRVTHSNVCRTYGSFTHVVRDADGNETTRFLVVSMELLEGETLSERLDRRGPLLPDEALPIVRQIVAGLQAAHDAEVIHRDLKARNVVLAPSSTGTRVVLTDFGLARPAGDGESGGLTQSGALVGTPAYMAPEQILGKPVTKAADIYSLGILLYEMVTGVRPFDGGTPVSIAVQRLKSAPLPPTTLRPDLPDTWERVILRCLELDAETRYANATDVVAALEGAPSTKARGRLRNKTARRQRFERIAAAVAVLLVVTAVVLVVPRWSRDAPASAGAPEPAVARDPAVRRMVAVLPFRSLSGDRWNPASLALAELVRVELLAGEHLRVAEPADVARARESLGDFGGTELSREALERIHAIVGAEIVVDGTFLDAPGDAGLRVDARLVDGGTGEVLAAFSESGADSELSRLVETIGEKLRSFLGVPRLDDERRAELAAARVSSAVAVELHARAVWGEGALDPKRASELLTEAVQLEPGYAAAYAALADAWRQRGLRREEVAAAETAVELSGTLHRADRLWIESKLAAAKQDWARAAEARQALFRFYPDDLTRGLALVEAQAAAGDLAAADATIAELRDLPSPVGTDPRIDFASAAVARRKAAFEEMERLASAGVARAVETGDALLAARGALLRGEALRELGRHEEAGRAAEEARATFRHLGDRPGAAEALALTGSIAFWQADYKAAGAALDAAVRELLDAGLTGRASRIANLLAGVPYARGSLAEAEEALRWSNALAKEAGDDDLDHVTLVNLSLLREMMGRCDEAIAIARSVESEARKKGASPLLEGGWLHAMGRAELSRGRVDRARELLHEAKAVLSGTTSVRNEGYVEAALALVELRAGNLDEAARAASASLEFRRQSRDRALVAESRLLEGEIALARGDATAAEAAARAALEMVTGGVAPPLEASARELLARSLVASDSSAARRAIDVVELEGQENPHIRIAVARARALVSAAEGDRARALEALEGAALEARRYGIVPERLAVQLDVLRIRIAADPSGAAVRRELTALEDEAKSLGFGLVAREAAALSGITGGR